MTGVTVVWGFRTELLYCGKKSSLGMKNSMGYLKGMRRRPQEDVPLLWAQSSALPCDI